MDSMLAEMAPAQVARRQRHPTRKILLSTRKNPSLYHTQKTLNYIVVWLAGWLVGWLVGWSVGWLVVGWLVGWLLVRSFRRLVGWLCGCWLLCVFLVVCCCVVCCSVVCCVSPPWTTTAPKRPGQYCPGPPCPGHPSRAFLPWTPQHWNSCQDHPKFRAFFPLQTLFVFNFRGLSLNCGGLCAHPSLTMSSQHTFGPSGHHVKTRDRRTAPSWTAHHLFLGLLPRQVVRTMVNETTSNSHFRRSRTCIQETGASRHKTSCFFFLFSCGMRWTHEVFFSRCAHHVSSQEHTVL